MSGEKNIKGQLIKPIIRDHIQSNGSTSRVEIGLIGENLWKYNMVKGNVAIVAIQEASKQATSQCHTLDLID